MGEQEHTPDSEAALLRRRLALFAAILTAMLSWVFVSSQLLLLATMPYEFPGSMFTPASTAVLAATLSTATTWRLLHRARPSETVLRAIDSGLLVFLCALAAAPNLTENVIGGSRLLAGLIVLLRAVTVPSTGRRTLILTAAAISPVVAVSVWRKLWRSVRSVDVAIPGAIDDALLVVAFVTFATIASRIIFDLRLDVAGIRALGKYRLGARLREDSVSAHYEAGHPLLRRPAELRLFPPGPNSLGDLRRIERAVDFASELTHPNTLQIYDFGRTPERAVYCVTEHIDGRDLETVVREDGYLDTTRLVHVLEGMCGALAEAHARGGVHGNVSPSTVFLARRGGVVDSVVVTSYGIAGANDRPMGVGPASRAPEDSRAAGPQGDVYSLGAIGLQLAGGTPTNPEATETELPRSLHDLLIECVATDPNSRPPGAAAVLHRLGQITGAK